MALELGAFGPSFPRDVMRSVCQEFVKAYGEDFLHHNCSCELDFTKPEMKLAMMFFITAITISGQEYQLKYHTKTITMSDEYMNPITSEKLKSLLQAFSCPLSGQDSNTMPSGMNE
jgi:hypothetical protein